MHTPGVEVARQGVCPDLVQPESLSVRNNLVLKERIRPVSGAARIQKERRRGGRIGDTAAVSGC